MKFLKFFLLAFGIGILFFTVKSIGFAVLASNLSSLGWGFLLLLAVYPFIFAFDTLGWMYAFPKFPLRVPFRELYAIRIIGEAFNCIIPGAASLGGEPLKAELLKRRHGIPFSQGLASILIVHTTFWLSLNCFVIGAILVTLKTLPLSPILWRSVVAFLVVLGLVALFLIIGLHFGVFKKVHTFGEWFKWWGAQSREKSFHFMELDQDIRKFYTANPKRFFLSTLFNLLGWLTGTLEVYVIAQTLGVPLGLAECWLFEALIQVLRIVTFFIPSSIGAQEGGIVLLFAEFGFQNSVGLTFAVIRRIRELLWIALGLVLWSLFGDKPGSKFKSQARI